MSSASFVVTYTFVYTDSEPGRVFWGTDEELSDEGSLQVIRVDLLMKDMISHQETILIVEEEASASHRIWIRWTPYVASSLTRVDLFMKDRIAHQETILIVEEEAYASREAWAHLVGMSQALHYEHQTHHEQVRIMAPVTRRGHNTPPNDTKPNNMTPESIQAMIDQALL
nr:hypothetical protein [Tanacetum cinerariifolium]